MLVRKWGHNARLILLSFCLLWAPTVSAQVSPSLRAATQGLGLGSQVRVSTFDSVFIGDFLGLEEAGFRLENELQVTRVRTANVWGFSHSRRAWRKGLLIGGATGLVVGAIGGSIAAAGCEYECGETDHSR